MAFEGSQLRLVGAVAGADLSAATTQYKFVKWNGTDNQVVLCAAVTDKPCGVLQEPAPNSAVGTPVVVAFFGTTKLQSNGSNSPGDLISTSATGQANSVVPGTDTTKYTVGEVQATGGSAAAGDYITANINCASPARAA